MRWGLCDRAILADSSMAAGDGLKEQLETGRANLAAVQKKAAAELAAMRSELQEARELASAEASKCGVLPCDQSFITFCSAVPLPHSAAVQHQLHIDSPCPPIRLLALQERSF